MRGRFSIVSPELRVPGTPVPETPKESIFYLKGQGSSDSQLEDFLNPKILSYGVVRAFQDIGSNKPPIPSSALKSGCRLKAIADHYGLRKVQDVPKVLIAYHILDYSVLNPSEAVVDPRKRLMLKSVADKICSYFRSVDSVVAS